MASSQEPSPAPRRLTCSIGEAAVLLGIGRASAYEAARTGQIPTIKLGRRLVVPRAALERLLSGEPHPLSEAASTDARDERNERGAAR